MANDSTPTNAAPAPPAPTPAPVIPPTNTTTPDLSGLVQPSQPPTFSEAVNANLQPYTDAISTATSNIAKASQPPAPVPPGPHAKLIAMVQGLALGLGAFGTAIATHGKEGGVQEVEQVQAEEQDQKIKAQQAAQAQRDAYIQQQMTVIDTNQKMGQNVLLMATLPATLTKADMEAKSATLGVQGQAQDIRSKALQDLIQTGDFAAYQNTVQKVGAVTGEAVSNAPTENGGTAAVPSAAKANWQNAVDAATEAYPTDLTIQDYAKVMQDPNSTPMQLAGAANGAKNRMASLDAGVASRTKQNAELQNSAYGKLSTPEALAAPGAQAAITAAINDPTVTPQDKARLELLLPQAEIAQANVVAQKKLADQAAQLVAQGNADAAGKMLADRTMTLDELKLRNATPDFMEKAVAAAQKYDPSYNAPTAANQAKVAGNEANQQFFRNTDSLLIHNGTLDQLNSAYQALGNTQLPALNSIANLMKYAEGSGPIAGYAAKLLGVVDDYAKVMGGSGGSSEKAQQWVLDTLGKNLSPDMFAQALAATRTSVESQRNGAVGTNPYLKLMYPDPSTLQETPGQTGASPIGNLGKSAYTRPTNVSAQAHLVQVAGYDPVWIEPGPKLDQALKVPGAKELQ